MASKEGSLAAPTRHPLAWKSDDFHDQASLDRELERVFDICHGCRRCVSLCGSFPTLFDLIDATADGEVHGVDKKDYIKVVDQCYLCDLCFMTKCPYVPPHEWNVDFPHLMLRAKAVKFTSGDPPMRDRVLSDTDGLGKLAGIPVVTSTVNALAAKPIVRSALESTLGVDKDAWLPSFATKTFRRGAAEAETFTVVAGERTPGKVAVFATCFVNFNEPQIGHDLLAILAHNAIPYVLVDGEVCCGMPKLEQGDLEGVAKKWEVNVPHLVELADAGYAILAPVPSCTLMFKQELPLMYPDDAATQRVREAMWDPFEYLVARHKDGLLNTDFQAPLGRISYQVPCHSRVQNIGKKTVEMLKLVPQTTVHVVERCSGHAGTFGVKKEFHAVAMKIGKPVFKSMAAGGGEKPDVISSDCQLAGHHIAEGMAEGGTADVPLAHPLTLLRRAYGV
jgi:Fe-S oxidoreductase